MNNANETYTALTEGNRRTLSRCITAAESLRREDQLFVANLLQLDTHNQARNTKRIAISGVPGVGKSTMINTLGSWLIECGEKVAVLAVDPSSTQSGGSILGDKTRMSTLDHHDNVYIRPSPTHGALGGVTHATRSAIQLCEIAGYTTVLVETVGVGQSEYAVANMTDMFITLLLHNAGDDLQAMKRGIMEITDLFVFNKVDDETTRRAIGPAIGMLTSSLQVIRKQRPFWEPPVCASSAESSFGLQELTQHIEAFFVAGTESEDIYKERKKQQVLWTQEEALRVLQNAMREKFAQPTVVEQVHTQLELGEHPLILAQKFAQSLLTQTEQKRH